MSYNSNIASVALLSLMLLSGILLGFSQTGLASGCKDVERKALLQFKQGLTDPSGKLSSWVEEDCCRWRGVSCDNETGNVVMLKLNNPLRDSFDSFDDDSANEVSGEISPSLLQLNDLQHLDLSMNNFRDFKIPEFIGSLQKLRYLNLSGSFFSGTIPQSLGNLSNLLYLDLNNVLYESKQIDLDWLSGLSSLKYINLGGADLSKAAGSWLEFFNKLQALVELHLPNTNLFNLPVSPFVNFTSLQVLDLSNNGFNTTIPHWFFNITSLVTLDLNSNDLQGDIPDGITSLNSLQELDLSMNSFLGGQLSRNLGKLCNLKRLTLSLNNFNGQVSDFIDGLSECTNSSSLERLELGFNQFIGNLPISLGNLKNLRYLELWFNSFRGSIPPSIGNLTFLKELYLSSNQMDGNFPESFGLLSAVEVLELSENPWEGVITETHLRNLSSLKELSLSKEAFNISLIFNISSDWIPPFKLQYIDIKSCQLGPKFPAWLKNQTEVMTLVLNNARISDTIPNWFWQLNLTLDELDLNDNDLSGRIPNSLGFRFPATVDLSSNHFDGALPLWSSNITKLYLRNNLFSGPIPRDFGRNIFLTDLDISYNFLNGSIPESMGNLNQLLSLDISNNNLTGEIPNFWVNTSSIYSLDMSYNSLSGEIPESMGSLRTARFLTLCNNHLSGIVPPSLRNCSIVDSLDLGDNQLSGNIPAWIGVNMPLLSILRLRSNHFNGTIPSELCRLPALHILDLLNLVDLSSNNLSGEIPEELTSLVYLKSLNLSRNQFVGEIPAQIGKLEICESLDLSLNKLSGFIPSSMVSLGFLTYLNLSYNNLSGEIPTGKQFQSLVDPSMYEPNLALCGPPLPKKCPVPGGTPWVSDGEEDEEEEEEEEEDGDGHDKLWLFLSVALGFILGFWGACGSLIFKMSWRYTYFRFVDDTKARFLTFVSLKVARMQRTRSENTGTDL